MSYHYKIVYRKKPGTDVGKYYASISSMGCIDLKDLAEEISALTALNRGDVYNAIDGLLQILPQKLRRGLRVKMGELGSFRMRANSVGKDTYKEVEPHCLKNKMPYFKCGKAFKSAVQGIHFEKIPQPEDEENK